MSNLGKAGLSSWYFYNSRKAKCKWEKWKILLLFYTQGWPGGVIGYNSNPGGVIGYNSNPQLKMGHTKFRSVFFVKALIFVTKNHEISDRGFSIT